MDEHAGRMDSPNIDWSLAVKWITASLLAHLALAYVGSFLLGERVGNGEILGFSVMAAVIGGVTCAFLFTDLPRVRLRISHWLVAATIAACFGWGVTLIPGISMLGQAMNFAAGYELCGRLCTGGYARGLSRCICLGRAVPRTSRPPRTSSSTSAPAAPLWGGRKHELIDSRCYKE